MADLRLTSSLASSRARAFPASRARTRLSLKGPAEALVLISAVFLISCGDLRPHLGGYRFGEDVSQARPSAPENREQTDSLGADSAGTDAGSPEIGADAGISALEREEKELENPDALKALIAEKLHRAEEQQPCDAGVSQSQVEFLSAHENWKLTPKQCLAELKKAGVAFHEPDFDTPLVETPLLLDGPINGVEIRPRWPGNNPVKAVMDCHLALALVELAKIARELGIKQVLFYSTYRPLKPPPNACKKGKAGARCRRRRAAYRRQLRSPSQHRRALAIDIRWLVTDDDKTLDVLESFDRRSGRPPCDGEPKTDESRLLQELPCRLHQNEIFNVVLTPNANKAHHNHFHFDITPDATWCIIR